MKLQSSEIADAFHSHKISHILDTGLLENKMKLGAKK